MLKFKEIKKSIIEPGPRTPRAQKPQVAHSPLQCSPTPHNQKKLLETGFETEKKHQRHCFGEFRSDCKENNSNQLYNNYDPQTPTKLAFGPPRHLKRNQTTTEYYEQKPLNEGSANKNLSFATLVHSRRPKPQPNQPETGRKDDRESSISKLKEKLFSSKRLIGVQQQVTTRAFTHRMPCQTERSHLGQEEEAVKVSMSDAFPTELDMSPFLVD